MTFQPARAEDIAAACADVAGLADFSAHIAKGLAAHDPDAVRNAVIHLIDNQRTNGLRVIVDRFRSTRDLGVFARVQGSRLHQIEGDYAAALADLEDATAQFPDRAMAYWWIGRARCLFELGRADEAQSVAREGAARFPDNAPAQTYVATLLGRRSLWSEALAAWDDMFARFDGRATSEMFVGRANALFHLDRVEEATAQLEARIAEAPEDVSAWRSLSTLAAQTGDRERLVATLNWLTSRFAAQSSPDWWADLARAHFEAKDYSDGEAALIELERRFPESALAERERVRRDRFIERGQDELVARVEAALLRFPDDVVLQSHWILMLLAQGRLALAERYVQAMELRDARIVQGYALVARLQLESDRGGDAHLRVYMETHAPVRDRTYADVMSVASFLLFHRAQWGLKLALDLLAGLREQATGRIAATMLRAKVLIARKEDDAALALIDSIPSAYRRSEINEMRAWAAYKRGRLDTARTLWRQNLQDTYFGALEYPVTSLERLSDDLPAPEDGVTAFIVYRNEALLLPGFLAHHRKLGVRRFVFFDHMSNDESCALLLKERDVVLYQSRDSFHSTVAGRRWINEIVRREGAKGWGLQVDPDECFVYPGWETTPLDRFLSYLEARGFEGVRSYMLDMFPHRLVGDDGEPTALSEYCYYDDDHTWNGQVRPPYLAPVGGARMRLFGASEYAHKLPLWRLDAAEVLNPHDTTPLALADVSSALLHYKLFNMTLRGRNQDAQKGGMPFLETDTDLEVLRRHSRYAARLVEIWRTDLFDPKVSRKLVDSLDLTERGLMTASPEYLSWLNG